MLHELILALNGHVGGLFSFDESSKLVKVNSVAFLHPGEKSLLNRICEHAGYYKQFQQFIECHINFNDQSEIPPGLYMNALCYCLRDDILSEYENSLVLLEQEILLNSDIKLTYIQYKLQDYALLFPALLQFLQNLESRKLRGCQLLGLVEKHSSTGIPTVQVAMNRLRFSLHQVMYKQLSSWLLQGTLMDPYSEFFVHKVKKIKSLTATPVNQDNEIGIGGITGEQLQQIQGRKVDSELKDDSSSTYFEQFSLRGEMLPPYLPIRLLHKIVFIGESVDMFEDNENINTKKSILKDRVMEFSKELYSLSQAPTFLLIDMENVIDSIRACVTERLWEFVVKESRLQDHLHRLKDIFLLGRGDLFQALIEAADVLLCCPPSPMTTHDANRVFHQVIRSLDMNDDSLQQFRLSVEAGTKDNPVAKASGWAVLSVQYKAEWPLQVFFTSVAIDRYNSIFKFLLAVRRVQVALHKAWKRQMTKWSWANSEQDQSDQLLLSQIRNHMQFLVDNLLTYLQVDVIESQFHEMLEKINSSKDFEIIRSAHETFQTNLLAQCFLLNVPVNHCLMCILESCTSFCTLFESASNRLTVDQLEHCQALQAMFKKQTLLLFKILTSTKTHQRNPYLVQLLLRIDFNKYFTSAGQQLG
ncbi:TUBGCP4 [Bugula neritina]|uniref:Gamma-tubulin complex component n=1 Tax=Bugula neritina TaxID=10212 RepID=A0A7J7KSX7_BUGNE|nr:TUBGCP4 [Bugula neritina]